MELINAICPNCGAKLNVDEGKDAAICEYCGNPYIVKKAVEKYNINHIYNTTNNINANVVNIVNNPAQSQKSTNKVFLVKNQITEEYFKRKILITLASKDNTPKDIASIKFSNLVVSYLTIIKYKANVDMNYTASVGYRQTENYVETSYRDGVQVVENKTRTKMVWSPISSSLNEDYDGIFAMDEEKKVDYSDIYKLIPDINTDELEEDMENIPFVLDDQDIKRIKNRAESGVEFSVRMNLPGDEYKELRSSSKVVITDLCVYKVPYSEISYAYNGKVYKVGCLALKESNLVMDTHPVVDPIHYENKQADKLKKASIGSWISWGIIFLLSIIVCTFTEYGLIIPWVGLISCVIIGSICGFKSVRVFNEGIQGHNKDVAKQRIESLNHGLASNNLFELTPNEKGNLEKISYAESIRPRRNAGFKTLTIIGSIATPIILLIFMVVVL